jgi:transposase
MKWFMQRRKVKTATSEICRVERETSDKVAHANHHAGTGKLDGMNNKIKVAERIAYGYRDDDYFFTPIRYQFPLGSQTIP